MRLPRPEPGLVIRYNFLWGEEAAAGQEHGSKARPCAIITAVERSGDRTLVTVVPLTHSPPPPGEVAIELPMTVKQSLRLDDERSWIVTNQLNTFAWRGSDLERIARGSEEVAYGRLPRTLLIGTLRAVLNHVRNHRVKVVRRSE